MVIVRLLTIAISIYLMYILYQQYKKGSSMTLEEDKKYRRKAIICDISVIAGIVVQIIGSFMTV